MRQQMRVGTVAATAVICLVTPGWAEEQATTVQVIQPPVRQIVRTVTCQSAIESYERATIQAKVTAYIDKWNVDIGDKVRKGDILASLFEPELVEDLATKRASVELAIRRVALAREAVTGAEADLGVANARVGAVRTTLAKQQTEDEHWSAEVARLKPAVDRGSVQAKVLAESVAQWKSSTAARDAAKAAFGIAEAEVYSKQAAVKKAALDVRIAQANLAIATSEARRLEAWTSYLKLTAPFDGVVVSRNANTFDLVQPAPGAPPIYVIDRSDIVRVFAEVSENDASYVHIGTKASLLARAYRATPIPARVTRTSWALIGKNRTLRAEIDLPNPGSQLLPGMRADVTLSFERPAVRAVPISAVDWKGGTAFCWMCENGRAVRTELETGVGDGEWIEVMNRRGVKPAGASKDEGAWTPINGPEQVIVGDRSMLADGCAVKAVLATSEGDIANAIRGHQETSPNSARDTGRSQNARALSEAAADDVTNKATAAIDQLRVELALERVKAAEAGVEASDAHVNETRLILTERQAEVDRWDTEVKRLQREVDRHVVDQAVLNESVAHLKSRIAARDAARATISTATAELRFRRAELAKAKVEVKLAEAVRAAARRSAPRMQTQMHGDKVQQAHRASR